VQVPSNVAISARRAFADVHAAHPNVIPTRFQRAHISKQIPSASGGRGCPHTFEVELWSEEEREADVPEQGSHQAHAAFDEKVE
jgi:hypothetical protein